jgi:DNA-binding response OmpR family regulator
MMPEMDGLVFCRSLCGSEPRCQLPVLLLSAKGGTASRVEGLQSGAWDYMEKPFANAELLMRLQHLAHSGGWNPKPRSAQDPWLRFLEKEIATGMRDNSFGLPQLAARLRISPRHLERKCQQLVGTSPGLLLRTRRLEKAAELLRAQPTLNISEVAQRVGMGPTYFSSLFSAFYGKTPTVWRKEVVES